MGLTVHMFVFIHSFMLNEAGCLSDTEHTCNGSDGDKFKMYSVVRDTEFQSAMDCEDMTALQDPCSELCSNITWWSRHPGAPSWTCAGCCSVL